MYFISVSQRQSGYVKYLESLSLRQSGYVMYFISVSLRQSGYVKGFYSRRRRRSAKTQVIHRLSTDAPTWAPTYPQVIHSLSTARSGLIHRLSTGYPQKSLPQKNLRVKLFFNYFSIIFSLINQ